MGPNSSKKAIDLLVDPVGLRSCCAPLWNFLSYVLGFWNSWKMNIWYWEHYKRNRSGTVLCSKVIFPKYLQSFFFFCLWTEWAKCQFHSMNIAMTKTISSKQHYASFLWAFTVQHPYPLPASAWVSWCFSHCELPVLGTHSVTLGVIGCLSSAERSLPPTDGFLISRSK